jgi:hypothetical protein
LNSRIVEMVHQVERSGRYMTEDDILKVLAQGSDDERKQRE